MLSHYESHRSIMNSIPERGHFKGMQDSAVQVSVLMPVYNCERYLDEAIRSIRAQTFTDFEFVIVNDGSTDGSLNIIRRHAAEDNRIILLDRPNGGYATALVEMARLAKGKYLARMDADDVSLPERFERQVSYLEANVDVVALGMQCERIDAAGSRLGDMPCPLNHEDIDAANLQHGGGGIAHPCALIRREAFECVRGYRPEFEPAEDGDLWMRLAEVGRLANLPEFGLRYRIHPNQTAGRRLERFVAVERAVRETSLRRGTRHNSERAMHHRNLSWAARDARLYCLATWHAVKYAIRSLRSTIDREPVAGWIASAPESAKSNDQVTAHRRGMTLG